MTLVNVRLALRSLLQRMTNRVDPGNFAPESLTDPCVKVSLYTAPIIQSQWYLHIIGGVTPNFQ